jgi:hypothetical protein
MLKKNGYDDSHIILIIDNALASDAKNPEPGVVRSEDNGENLYNNVIVDTTTPHSLLLTSIISCLVPRRIRLPWFYLRMQDKTCFSSGADTDIIVPLTVLTSWYGVMRKPDEA